MYTKLQSHLRAQLDSIREQGLYKSERIITTPQNAHVGVTGQQGCSQPLREQLSGPRRPSARDRCGEEGDRRARQRPGQRAIHLRHAGYSQAARKSELVRHSSALKTRSCSAAAGTPTADCLKSMLGPEDAVISDELNHASIIDGIRLCKAQRFRYKNNDPADLEAQAEGSGHRRRDIG